MNYPIQLDAAYNDITERPRAQRREELQIPLSVVLSAEDRNAILAGVVERVVRDLAYRRPDRWFTFINNRVDLRCPDEDERKALCEMKAARDALEHCAGVIGADYLEKAGSAARYAAGDVVQIDEPYLIRCFGLLRDVVDAMAAAAIQRASGEPRSSGPSQ